MNSESMAGPTLIKKSLGWRIFLSVLMIVAGILAIVAPPAAGIAVTILIGWLLLLSGLAHFVYAWHTRGTGATLWEVLVGIAYVVIGGYVISHPLLAMASLTLGLAIYLFAESILEFIQAFQLRSQPGRGWLFVDGFVSLILAVMIWRTWPSSTAWVLGTLVGISMLFRGMTRLMIALAARKLVARIA